MAMTYKDHEDLRERARRLGLHISICMNYNDKQALLACASDEEFKRVHSEICQSISRVSRANLRINHSNFRNLPLP